MREPPSKRSKTAVVMVPGKSTESPGKFLQFSGGLMGVVRSGKLNRPELVRLSLVRLARTSCVSCRVSPGKSSAFACELEALKRANAGATVDASAASSVQKSQGQLPSVNTRYDNPGRKGLGTTDEEHDYSLRLSGSALWPTVPVQH